MSTRRALLIGINDYPLLDHLKYAEQDAVAVADAIQRHYGFSENEVVLMTSRESGAKFPTQRFIEKQLKMLRDVHHGLELLLIGFWGHGFLSDNRRYLCATDTDEEELARTGISFESLLSMAAQAGAQNTCIILDCCQKELGRGFSNTFTEAEEAEMMRGVAVTARDIVAARRNRGITAQITPSLAVLHSCSAGQRAYEWDDRQHGVFTAHLLDAIEQRLTGVSQLATYVSRHVPITASELSKEQVPCFKLEGGGDIVFEIGESIYIPATPIYSPPVHSVDDEVEAKARKTEVKQRHKKKELERKRRLRAKRWRAAFSRFFGAGHYCDEDAGWWVGAITGVIIGGGIGEGIYITNPPIIGLFIGGGIGAIIGWFIVAYIYAYFDDSIDQDVDISMLYYDDEDE